MLTLTAVLFFTCLSSVQADFSVDITYTCSKFNGTCVEWKQVGKIVEDTAACFPGDSVVITEDGPLSVDSVKIGDKVLAYDFTTNAPTWTTVTSWFHRMPKHENNYIELLTEAGSIQASPFHNLAYVDPSTLEIAFKYAGNFVVGDLLLTAEGQQMRVTNVQKLQKIGVFAPHTVHSNLYVASSANSTPFLAHTFAHIRNPRYYETALAAVMKGSEFFFPTIHELPMDHSDTQKPYIHPVASVASRIFPFMLDHAPREYTVEGGQLRSAKTPRSASSQQQQEEKRKSFSIFWMLSPPHIFWAGETASPNEA